MTSEPVSAPSPPAPGFRRAFYIAAWQLAALLAAGLFLYTPAVNNQFVYNDISRLTGNASLSGEDFVRNVFTPKGAAANVPKWSLFMGSKASPRDFSMRTSRLPAQRPTV